MGAPRGVDIGAVVEQEVRHVEVAVHDGPGERHVEDTLLALRAPLVRIFVDSPLRHVRTEGVVILDIAKRRRAGASNHCFTRERLPMPAACGRSSGSGQMRVSNGMRWVFTYVNANSMACDGGGGWRRRIAGSRSRRAAMNSPRSFSVAASMSPPETPRRRHRAATAHAGRPRRTPSQVAILGHRADDLLHDKRFHSPTPVACDRSFFDEVADEGAASDTSIDVCAELGIERDASFQQE